MFKQNWEKTNVIHKLPECLIEKATKLAYPHKLLSSYQLICGGCANLNIKIQFKNDTNPLILRIYLRDKESAYKEQHLYQLIKENIPVPEIYYIGEIDDYRFAFLEFMPGITLRDYLIENEPYNIDAIMYEVGSILAKISTHEFSKSGFFDKDLNIFSEGLQDNYLNFAKKCLKNKTVLAQLSHDAIAKINAYLKKHGFPPDERESCLVHADFDPANILVDKIDGIWKVTAILDWEFAFSGSSLCDVANMLRYKHYMPLEFEKSFLTGLKAGGIILPKNWLITTHMLNILSLLDCLSRSDPKNRPNQLADIKELIEYFLQELS